MLLLLLMLVLLSVFLLGKILNLFIVLKFSNLVLPTSFSDMGINRFFFPDSQESRNQIKKKKGKNITEIEVYFKNTYWLIFHELQTSCLPVSYPHSMLSNQCKSLAALTSDAIYITVFPKFLGQQKWWNREEYLPASTTCSK